MPTRCNFPNIDADAPTIVLNYCDKRGKYIFEKGDSTLVRCGIHATEAVREQAHQMGYRVFRIEEVA